MKDALIQQLRSSFRTVPDYPKPGILFRDVTTLLKDPRAFGLACDWLQEASVDFGDFEFVAGVESRGFIFGAVLANRLGKGFVPVRKPGKLPAAVFRESYALEYGEDALEVHRDALHRGAGYLVVDDLLATGGTARATCKLLEKGGGAVQGCLFLVELPDLNGRTMLAEYSIRTLVEFEGH